MLFRSAEDREERARRRVAVVAVREVGRGLDELLDDDVIFYSPIVYTPQVGKAITTLYLSAAGQTLPGDKNATQSDPSKRFHYTKQVISGDTAVLEFETTVEGKYVNGVDIIRCNERGPPQLSNCAKTLGDCWPPRSRRDWCPYRSR